MNTQQNSTPTKFFTRTRVVLILALYTPFLGYSYLKGYLHGAGFTNTIIEAPPQELIFQALTALGELFSMLVSIDLYTEIAWSSLKLGIFFAFILPSAFIISRHLKYSIENNESAKTYNLKELVNKFLQWMYSKPKIIIKTLLTSLTGFCTGFLLSYITLILLFILLAFILVILVVGNMIGRKAGLELTKQDICKTKEWQDGEIRRLGCNVVSLKNAFKGKTELKGWRLYSSPSTLYLLTNDGAYELSSDLNVKLFTPNQKNENAHITTQ